MASPARPVLFAGLVAEMVEPALALPPIVLGVRIALFRLHARARRGHTLAMRSPELVGDAALGLELGDHVRVLAPPSRLPGLAELFGDSFRSLGEVDVLAFSARLAGGLLLGDIPIPLPDDGTPPRSPRSLRRRTRRARFPDASHVI